MFYLQPTHIMCVVHLGLEPASQVGRYLRSRRDVMGLLAMTETNYLSDQLSQIKVKKTPPEFQFQTSEYDVHLVFKVQNECRLDNS